MFEYKDRICAFIDQRREEMLSFLKEFVNLEGHFNEREKVEAARDFYRKALEEEGFVCRIVEVAPESAGILVADLGQDRPGKPIILEGHADTVFYAGTFAGDNPFRTEGEIMYGPGVLDMKGGLVIALYIVKALNHIGFDTCPIRIVVVGDEERDHVGNNGDQVVTESCAGGGIGLSFEVASEDRCLATARKAQINYDIEITGVGGHAGNDFWRAKNALVEANRIMNEALKLTCKETETTVTPSILQAGSHQSAIPEKARLNFDIRYVTMEERKRVTEAFEELLDHPSEGYRIQYQLIVAKLPPLEETESNLKVWRFLNEASEVCGYPPFGKALRGGANDAGNVSRAGVPTICSCGTTGKYAHSTKEYAHVDSLYERAVIFATALSEIAAFYSR